MMRLISTLAVAAGLAALAACNNSPRDDAADNIEASAENQADMIEENADMTTDNIDAAAENEADAVREEGDNAADAVANNGY